MLRGLTKIIVPLFLMYSLNCSNKVDVGAILDYTTTSKSIAKTTEQEITFSQNNDTLYITGSGRSGKVISRAVTVSDLLSGNAGEVIVMERKDGVTEFYNLREYKRKGKTYIVPFDRNGSYPILTKKHNGAKAYLWDGKTPALNGRPEV
jgi:hypothetical protein